MDIRNQNREFHTLSINLDNDTFEFLKKQSEIDDISIEQTAEKVLLKIANRQIKLTISLDNYTVQSLKKKSEKDNISIEEAAKRILLKTVNRQKPERENRLEPEIKNRQKPEGDKILIYLILMFMLAVIIAIFLITVV